MPIEGLTPHQSAFIERFLKVPLVFNRKAAKERRRAAAEEFRVFNAHRDLLRDQIADLDDATMRTLLTGQLRQAQGAIEADPDNLNFAGGHAQLDSVQGAVELHLSTTAARPQFAEMETRMAGFTGSDAPSAPGDMAKSDIALTWAFVQDKFAAAQKSNLAKDYDDALRAMARLDVMLDNAAKTETNPFAGQEADLSAARENALANLSSEATTARGKLFALHEQYIALKDKLTTAFGEDNVPLALSMGCTSIKTKLDAAADAAPDAITMAADDVEAEYLQTQRAATTAITNLQTWNREHAAFLVRYAVMRAHAMAGDTAFVKPQFDDITAAYTKTTEEAAAHDYAGAIESIADVRRDLKDALDFADDYAGFAAVLAARKALITTLPARTTLHNDSLRDDFDDINETMTGAETARDAGQMKAGRTLLNLIPKAIGELIATNKRAKEFTAAKANWDSWIAGFAGNYSTAVLDRIKDEREASLAGGRRADEAADDGNFAKALMLIKGELSSLRRLKNRADLISAYLTNANEFTTRRRAIRACKGAGGRIAAEGYYQALVADNAQRKTAEDSGNYKLANTLCLRRKGEHNENMRLAAQAKDYLEKKALFDTEFAKLTGSTPDAQRAIQTADDMRAEAIAATQRGNWQAAANILENALLEVDRAIGDVKTDALIDGLQASSTISDLETPADFDAAFAEFTKARALVEAADKTGAFTDPINAAEAQARTAKTLVATDAPAARSALSAAIGSCKEMALQASAMAGYDIQSTAAKALVAQVRTANTDGLMDDTLVEFDADITRGEGQAAAPDPDFATAIATMCELQSQARVVLDFLVTFNSTIAPAVTEIRSVKTLISGAAHKHAMDDLTAKLDDAIVKIFDDINALDFRGARQKAKDGQALAAGYRLTFARYISATEVIKNKVTAARGIEQTHAITGDDNTDIEAKIAGIKALYRGKSFLAAEKAALQCASAIENARTKALAFDTYLQEKIRCEAALTALEDRDAPAAGPGHDMVVELRKRFDAVLAQADLHNYKSAFSRLDKFVEACTPAGAALDLYGRFVLLQTNAQAALERVRAAKTPAIDPLFARLEGKERNAARKGAGFDFILGNALYEELVNDCANAQNAITTQQNFTDVITQIKDIAENDTDDLKAATAAAEATLGNLQNSPSAVYVFEEVVQARARLKDAKDNVEADFATSRDAVKAVVDGCVQMALQIAQYDQLNDSAAVARGLAQGLLDTHAQADFARDEITTKLAAIETAMIAARSNKSNRSQTQTDIEAAIAELRDLRKVLDAHATYVAKRTPIEAALVDLEKHADRHLIGDELVGARRSLDNAQTRATGRDHTSAIKELDKVALLIEAAKLRIKIASNTAPSAQELETILAAPDGQAMLDDIVNTLEPDVQRTVMKAAFEARFGCKLELFVNPPTGNMQPETEMDRPAPNVRRFYEEMSKLPPSDTLDNDSLLTFAAARGETGQTAYYFGPVKAILMREGDADKSRVYPISLEHEVGDIDENAIPKPGKEKTAFSWNTLHEVGHAVDDKLGYMKSKGKTLAGWTTYGANIMEAATAIAGEYNFDPNYVAEYMISAQGQVLPMPPPKDCQPEEWDRRCQTCRIFVDRCREGNHPWMSASVASACTIKGFTYVESYEGIWSRYSADARKLAVSGYQFRAEGEWFSELYAAYHTDRLNDNHPHRDWLSKL